MEDETGKIWGLLCVTIILLATIGLAYGTTLEKKVSTSGQSINPETGEKKSITNTKTIKKIKKKHKIISGYFKPNTKRLKYKWYFKKWINYCPGCHTYGTLRVNPKHVPESELTCKKCDMDYDGVRGREKITGSHKYLTPA
jgi:hypothetical protein